MPHYYIIGRSTTEVQATTDTYVRNEKLQTDKCGGDCFSCAVIISVWQQRLLSLGGGRRTATCSSGAAQWAKAMCRRVPPGFTAADSFNIHSATVGAQRKTFDLQVTTTEPSGRLKLTTS